MLDPQKGHPHGEEKALLRPLEFLRETPNGSIASRRRVPKGTRVNILISSSVSSLAEYRNHHLWIANELLDSIAPAGEPHLATATSQGTPASPEKPHLVAARLNPDLLLEEHTPFEICARISSLKLYSPSDRPQSRPSNRDLLNSISPADFSLVWGAYDRPGFRSRQEERKGVAQYPDSWNTSLGDVRHSWRNFHLISSSPEITEKIRSCQPQDRILLRGSLSSVYRKDGRALWKGSRAMGFCPVVVVHSLEILPPKKS